MRSLRKAVTMPVYRISTYADVAENHSNNFSGLFLSLQVEFWGQHVSFFLVGIIVVTSIRGLLITFTKVPPTNMYMIFFSAFSVGCYIHVNEEKVICYQLELGK